MKLFIDEDTGPGIAKALIDVGIRDVEFIGKGRHYPKKTSDLVWLPYAGDNGKLVLSRNHRILTVDAERELLIAHSVGIVFLPQHLTAFELLRLVLRRWDWLEQLDAQSVRPFAYYLRRGGTYREIVLRRTAPE